MRVISFISATFIFAYAILMFADMAWRWSAFRHAVNHRFIYAAIFTFDAFSLAIGSEDKIFSFFGFSYAPFSDATIFAFIFDILMMPLSRRIITADIDTPLLYVCQSTITLIRFHKD